MKANNEKVEQKKKDKKHSYEFLVDLGAKAMTLDVPDYRKARTYFLDALEIQKDEEVLELLKECDDKLAKRLKFKNLLRQSSILSNEGKKEEAVKLYLKAIEIDPSIELSRQYYSLLRKNSDPDSSNKKQYIEAERLFNSGLLSEEKGNLDKALEYFNNAFQINPSFKYLEKIVNINILFSNFKTALDLIAETVKANSTVFQDVEIKINILIKKVLKIRAIINDRNFVDDHVRDLNNKISEIQNELNEIDGKNHNRKLYLEQIEITKKLIEESKIRLKKVNKELRYHFIRMFDSV
jgi:tetratricopeptide (TPR) repeat protein